jgi:erythronate-4-phosphate dehydrogenase
VSLRRIVVDENVPMAQEAFGPLGLVELVPGRSIPASLLREADALVVRSITRVDAALLEGSRVRAVGTCTIGTDHLDIPWLEAQGIRWSAAPGCNARSVGEHVVAALCHLHRIGRIDLARPLSLGIVGLGNTGSALAGIASALGWAVRACDPPRAAREGGDFRSLEELVQTCDVLSLHVPLIRSGAHPTWRLADLALLSRLRPGAVLVNAARGPVLDPDVLLDLRRTRPDLSIVLDVFDPEPAFPPEMPEAADLLSPHVAGYSLEGKIEGTRRIRNWLGRLWDAPGWVPGPTSPLSLELPESADSEWDRFAAMVLAVHDPRRDDAAMRELATLPGPERGKGFDRLRKEYPVRREWGSVAWRGVLSGPALDLARKAGFVGL